jgi:hypothetical protein
MAPITTLVILDNNSLVVDAVERYNLLTLSGVIGDQNYTSSKHLRHKIHEILEMEQT